MVQRIKCIPDLDGLAEIVSDKIKDKKKVVKQVIIFKTSTQWIDDAKVRSWGRS